MRVDYMLTGAIAASYFGMPRTTVDIDMVVKVSKKNIKTLAAALREARMQIDERKIIEAFESSYKIVTIKDTRTRFTLDIILSNKKLEKKKGTILGLPTFYQIPEELILSKLRMIKATISKERAVKDKDDVRAILRHTKVNVKALENRAKRESTFAVLRELMEKESG